jgi:hypothetical protein
MEGRPARRAAGGPPRRLRRALPSLRIALSGAVLWGCAMGASALLNLLFLHDWETPARLRFVFLLFAAGGGVAFPLAIWLARLLSLGRRPQTAFAAAFVCLLASTIALTGGFYALQYLSYYSEWHGPAFTYLWLNQFVFTFAAALYQFAVLGVRLYFPLGFAVLFAASLWFARLAR